MSEGNTLFFRVLDLETTGFPPNAEAIQVGYTDMSFDTSTKEVHISSTTPEILIKPQKFQIGLEALATHHITHEDLEDASLAEDVLPPIMDTEYPVAFVAHNAAFEKQFLGSMTKKPWICTMKCAYQAWPDAPRFTNQVLRYYLGCVPDRQRAMPPHAAGPDTYTTACILGELLKKGMSVSQLIDISNNPALLPKVMFGKHKGQKWTEVPASYLSWILGQGEMDEDVRYTARHYYKARFGNNN